MVEWRVMLLCVILMVLHPRLASAQLTLYHGRIASNNVDLDQVEGVAVLNLGGPMINHFFDCHTATGSPSDLVWSREGGFQRFLTAPANIVIDEQGLDVLRMDMAPPNDDIVGYSDADIYTCTNSQSGESVSINITGGATAVCAVEPSYDVNLDGTAELRVYEAGDPPLTSSDIVWRSPRGERIASDGRLTLHDKNTRLVIRNVGLEDSGTYTINVVREVTLGVFRTSGTTATELNVHVGPEVTSNPAPMEILEHNMVTLTCVVRGNPSPDVVWEREGSEPLPVTTRQDITRTSMLNDSVTLYTVTSNLIIHNVLFEDQGRYRCVATNTVTGGAERTDSSTLAQLTVIPRLQLTATPPITADSNLLRVVETTFVQVSCSGSGNLNWRSVSGAAIEVNTELSPSVNRYQFFDFTNNIQRLVVQSFASADSDLYVCTSDLVVSGSADVVSTSLFITTADPAVYFAEGTVYATLGSTAELEVSVHTSSSNPLTVQWYHEGSLLDTATDPRYSTSAESSSLRALILSGVASNILGRYLVAVTVDGRTENATVSLQLPEPPTVSVVPTSQGISEHENATFQCVAGGTRSTIQWTSTGNQPLPGGVTQEGDGLFVQQASRDHAGMYECHVTNQAGTVVGSALLTVFFGDTTIGGATLSTEAEINTADSEAENSTLSVGVVAGAATAGVLSVLILTVLIVSILLARRRAKRKTSMHLTTPHQQNEEEDQYENITPTAADSWSITKDNAIPNNEHSIRNTSTDLNPAYGCHGDTKTSLKPSQIQGIELSDNAAYVLTPSIPVETNECYGTNATSLDSDPLYDTPRGEDIDYVIP